MITEEVPAGGLRFRLRRHEPARRRRTPPALLLHGADADAADLDPLAAELGADRRVLAPDLPGCGGSEAAGPYDPDGLAVRVAALVAAVEEGRRPAGPVDVVGHDLGAVVALALARHRPDLVRRVALVAAADSRAAPRLAARLFAARPAGPAARGCATAVLRAGWAGGRGVRTERALVVYGTADRWLPPPVGERLVRELVRAAPFAPGRVAATVVPGGGHAPHRRAPDVVWPRIAGFLRAP